MPRHNCSDLQRFAKNCDTSGIWFEDMPEIGPVSWKLQGRSGPARKYEKPVMSYNKKDGVRQYKETFALSDEFKASGYLPRLESLRGQFPVFKVNEHRYSAMRWLYFQLYDDRNTFSYHDYENNHLTVLRGDAATNKNKNRKKTVDDKNRSRYDEFLEIEELKPNQLSSYNCTHQQQLGVIWWSHDWRAGISPLGFLPNKLQRSKNFRPWNMMFWFDPDQAPRRPAGAPDLEQLTKTRRPGSKRTYYPETGMYARPRFGVEAFQHIPLVHPHIVGPDRIEMVRAYLRGATDDDVAKMNFTTKVSPDWLDWQKQMEIELDA